MGRYFGTLLRIVDVKTSKWGRFLSDCLMRRMQYLLFNLFVYLPVFIKIILSLLANFSLFSLHGNYQSNPKIWPVISGSIKNNWHQKIKIVQIYSRFFLFKMQYLLSNLFIFHLVFCKSKFKLQSSRWTSFWYRMISSNKPSGPYPLTISSDKCAIVDVKTWKSSKFIPVYLLVKMQYLLSNLFIYVLVFC